MDIPQDDRPCTRPPRGGPFRRYLHEHFHQRCAIPPKALAGLVGYTHNHFNRMLNLDPQETASLDVETLLALLQKSGDLRPLVHLAELCGAAVVDLRQVRAAVAEAPTASLQADFLTAAQELGDVSRRLLEGLADGRLTARELPGLTGEIEATIRALCTLRCTAEAVVARQAERTERAERAERAGHMPGREHGR